MLSEQLQGLQTVFTRRFLFNALLPTLVALTINVVCLAVFSGGWPSVGRWWMDLDILTRAVAVLGYLAAVWFVAVAVAAQWRAIVRFFEGYPLRAIASRFHLPTPGVRWHQKNLRWLRNEVARGEQAYYLYPRERWVDDVLPTRLGNILLAAERYPIERYGVDPVIFWPRLYPLLPAEFRQDYEEFVRDYEFPLTLAALASLTGAICGLGAFVTGQSPATFALAFAGPLIVAYAAYCLALPSAIEMAEQQRTAFDLYRGRLLAAWPTVADVTDELEAFGQITDFVVANAPAGWSVAHERRRSRHADEAAPSQSAGAGA
jgi:hypothetical protein